MGLLTLCKCLCLESSTFSTNIIHFDLIFLTVTLFRKVELKTERANSVIDKSEKNNNI